MTPIGIPISSQSMAAPMASWSVTDARLMISSRTGERVL